MNETASVHRFDLQTRDKTLRTILAIDDDLLMAAKEMAGLEGAAVLPAAGFMPFPAKEGVSVSDELVKLLRDAEGL